MNNDKLSFVVSFDNLAIIQLKMKEKDGFGLSLWLPTSVIKSKLFLRIIRKRSDNNNVKIYLKSLKF